jgi:cytochrome o ubiquinol oxidase subunit 3
MINSLRPVQHEEDLSRAEREADSTTLFGFWMYLMTDFVLFASLFAVYAVLRGNTFGLPAQTGGPSGRELFDLPYVLIETLLLLTSSFTFGLVFLAARSGKRSLTLLALAVTAILGLSFVIMEVSEFTRLIAAGNGPQLSGFLSSYFALVGTHGLHVAIGLIWMVALMISIARGTSPRRSGLRPREGGFTRSNMRKLMLLGMFWHFLDIIWIFIFTIVYLMGVT